MTSLTPEIDEKRFAFGKNWSNFLKVLNDTRIEEAEESLKEMLGTDSLAGKSVLDIGSGSGLFSLVARRLGAQVVSFDYDPQSVACTKELKKRYFPDDKDEQWRIEQGSALDLKYLETLGTFDIVYSWGVLHHTGDMYKAFENVIANVAPDGLLFISIYNDEGWRSEANKKMKEIYNGVPALLKTAMTVSYYSLWVAKGFVTDCIKLQNPLTRYTDKEKSRGMSVWYDIVDWLGGYPYEVAKPDKVFDFYFQRGFHLVKLKAVTHGHGCNEFVFQYAHPVVTKKTQAKIKCAG